MLYQNLKSNLNHLTQGKSRIAIAVSGGSDSMALALLLGEYSQNTGTEIIALTVDHKLRKESATEAKQVGLWLEKYNIKHHILSWEGDKKPSNIQAEARKARYRLMADFCALHSIISLAVADTLEDQAETVLMRLMRGSGVDGLAGISESNDVFGIKIIRPLLCETRENLRDYLRRKKQEWIDDPSNENSKFKRVEVRKFIKNSEEPELLSKRLADTASHMARAKDYIEERIRERLVGVFTFHDAGFYTINTAKFKALHDEERLRALTAALHHVSGQDYRPRFENLSALHDNILNGNIGSGCTLWGCEILPGKKKGEEGTLYIYREPSQVADNIEVSGNSKITWDGRFVCEIGDININDLRLGALGVSGYQSISKSIINAAKLPKKVIYTLPALKALEKVLAVPHIGYYADENLRQIFCSRVKVQPRIFKEY